MPDCPPDLSEPQYASLMFEHTCFASDHVLCLVDLLFMCFRHAVSAGR